MKRVRNLVGATTDYYGSWRGAFVILSLVLAVGLVAVTGVSAAGVFGSGLLLAVVILLLLAHEARRSEDRRREIVDGKDASQLTPRRVQARPSPLEMPPLVTVVVTAHNEARFLAVCLESLRQQTFRRWEAIVIDDASTDDTDSVTLRYCRADSRYRLVTTSANVGLAEARNIGLSHVNTPLVTFLDGDDFLFERSLEARMSAMPSTELRPWVGGVYCNWMAVPEDAGLDLPSVGIPDRGTVTWLDSPNDAPFIASAPIVRTDVVRRSGGFAPELPTAEDAAMWNSILRNGWIFESVDYTGVAYRMKKSSMYKSTAVIHTDIISRYVESNILPADPNPAVPFRFTEPYFVYGPRLTRWRRLIGVAAALIQDNGDVEPVLAELEETFEPYMAWVLDVGSIVSSNASRATNFGGMQSEYERALVRDTLLDRLLPLQDRTRRDVLNRLQNSSPAKPVRRGLEARPAPRVNLSSPLLTGPGSPVEGKVVLLPGARYHMEEIGPLAAELRRRGVDSVVMADDRRWPSVEDAVAVHGIPAFSAPDAGDWLKDVRAIVALNDWGEYFRLYVEGGNDRGVPTFAKVEGVQDFNDDDVHWERRPYQRASTILAQGANDVAALPDQTTRVVGSTRLERIWQAEPRPYTGDLAVINLNFTYGVLGEARDLWINTVVEACEKVSMPFVVSMHPAERDHWDARLPLAKEPIRHLLTKGSVLISRFSTVPFEAMARGVPFVYHNPHGERVPTFKNPDGAFEISTNADTLASAIEASRQHVDDYRDVCAEFFLSQVDVDPERSSEARTADVILAAIKG